MSVLAAVVVAAVVFVVGAVVTGGIGWIILAVVAFVLGLGGRFVGRREPRGRRA
jgi:hypothetical protein